MKHSNKHVFVQCEFIRENGYQCKRGAIFGGYCQTHQYKLHEEEEINEDDKYDSYQQI